MKLRRLALAALMIVAAWLASRRKPEPVLPVWNEPEDGIQPWDPRPLWLREICE